MESTLRISVNEDGQFVITDRIGDVDLYHPVTVSRERTLLVAMAVLGRRMLDGTLNPSLSLVDTLRRWGVIEDRSEQGDRTLTVRYEDAA